MAFAVEPVPAPSASAAQAIVHRAPWLSRASRPDADLESAVQRADYERLWSLLSERRAAAVDEPLNAAALSATAVMSLLLPELDLAALVLDPAQPATAPTNRQWSIAASLRCDPVVDSKRGSARIVSELRCSVRQGRGAALSSPSFSQSYAAWLPNTTWQDAQSAACRSQLLYRWPMRTASAPAAIESLAGALTHELARAVSGAIHSRAATAPRMLILSGEPGATAAWIAAITMTAGQPSDRTPREFFLRVHAMARGPGHEWTAFHGPIDCEISGQPGRTVHWRLRSDLTTMSSASRSARVIVSGRSR